MEEEERLKNFIEYGHKITRVYEETRLKYLEFHLIFSGFISVAVSYFATFLNREGQSLIGLGIIILMILVIFNLIISIGAFSKKTEQIKRTNWHYRENITRKSKKFRFDLDDKKLIEDDKQQYNNLLIYQKRYFCLLRITQTITVLSMIPFIIFLILSFGHLNP
ncbi:MAG: hypothetical protein CEE43_02175 [Promethearchaeota archaeon Loki_b32]|nr:MAG: hypothetical protein CEE43_02175 [Candidatus Lokiarchaeota archaeon Loki_b32]